MPTDAGTVTCAADTTASEAISDAATDVWACDPYPTAEGVENRGTATNTGSVTAYPIVTITGPGTNPGLVNETTGDEMLFSEITLADTDTLVADCRTHRVRLNGGGGPYPNGWLTLQPGANTIAARCAGPATGFAIDMDWSDRWES